MKDIYDIIREQKVLVDLNIMKYDSMYTNELFLNNQETFYIEESLGGKLLEGVKKVIEYIKKVIAKIGELFKRVFDFFRGETDVVKKAEEQIKAINKAAAEKEAGVEPKEEPKKEEPKSEEPKEEPKKEEPKEEPKSEEPKEEPKKEEPKPEPKPEPKKEEPKPEPKKEEPKPEPKGPSVNYTSYSNTRPQNIKSGENKMMDNKFGAYIDARSLKELLSNYKLRVYIKNPCGPFSKREALMKKMPAVFSKAIDTAMNKFDMLEKNVYESGKDFNAENLCLSILSMDLFGEKYEFVGSENAHNFIELMKKELGDGIKDSGMKIDTGLKGYEHVKDSEAFYVNKIADDIIEYCSKGPQFCKELGNMRKRLQDRLDKLMDEIETRNVNALTHMGFRLGSIVIDIFGELSYTTTQMYNTYKKIIKAAIKDYAKAKDLGMEMDFDHRNKAIFKSIHTY